MLSAVGTMRRGLCSSRTRGSRAAYASTTRGRVVVRVAVDDQHLEAARPGSPAPVRPSSSVAMRRRLVAHRDDDRHQRPARSCRPPRQRALVHRLRRPHHAVRRRSARRAPRAAARMRACSRSASARISSECCHQLGVVVRRASRRIPRRPSSTSSPRAADVGGHDRQPARHRLDQRVGQPLPVRGQPEQIGLAQQLVHVGALARQLARVGESRPRAPRPRPRRAAARRRSG